MEPRGLLEDAAGRPRWLQLTGQSVTEERAVQKGRRTEERKSRSRPWISADEPSSLLSTKEHSCISQGFPENQKQ